MAIQDYLSNVLMRGDSKVPSGAELDIESGGSLKLAGTAISSSAAELNLLDGATAATLRVASTVNKGETFSYDLGEADAVGGIVKVQNPLGVAAIVEYIALDVATAATAACTLDVGIDSDGTTSDDTLIDGLDVNAATGLFSSENNGGTNGAGFRRIGATEYLVASMATGAAAGLAGHVVFRLQPIANL